MTDREAGAGTMSGKHTAGPWQYYAYLPSVEPNWHIVTNASRMRVVANVHIEPGNAMDEANARLIAAAPDLLEALKVAQKALAMLVSPDVIVTTSVLPAFAMVTAAEAQSRAALSRAEGKPSASKSEVKS